MYKILITISFLMVLSVAYPQYAGYTVVNDITGFKDQFSAASQKTQTIQSDFVQEKTLSLLSEKITSNGKFLFKKENKVRMEYLQPYQYLMVINKNEVMIKDGQ